jgi:hypothetical protein
MAKVKTKFEIRNWEFDSFFAFTRGVAFCALPFDLFFIPGRGFAFCLVF